MITVGQRVTSIVWGEKREGVVTLNNGTGIVWVLWDGDKSAKWMHEESLTLKGRRTMDRATAIKWIQEQVKGIGLGFHPDSEFDYVDRNGKPLFTAEEAAERLETLNKCFDLLGDEIYDIAYEAMEEIR